MGNTTMGTDKHLYDADDALQYAIDRIVEAQDDADIHGILCDFRKAVAADRSRRIEEIAEVLYGMLRIQELNVGLACQHLHHPEGFTHSINESCKVVKLAENAVAEARTALEKYNELS